MKLCLAGTYSREFLKDKISESKYILESFWYVKDWQKPFIKSKHWDLFLLDSGAFSFMNSPSARNGTNYYDYLERYIKFINECDVDHFFELDIDSIVGYQEVLKMRKILEQRTGKKCIPVFHKSRGLAEWEKMCQEYDYVAIGTISEYKKNHGVLKELLKIAKKYNTKVHGLGFTINNVEEFGFYSVDSTSWLSGSRHGTIYLFKDKKITTVKKQGYRTTHYRGVDRHNISEWNKYQKYLGERKK